jgi:hypothetical protein
MSGNATISDNTVTADGTGSDSNFGNGGGVYVDNSGEFNMEGGTISGNTVTGTNTGTGTNFYNGGGVYVYGGGTFTKTNGGFIYGSRTEDDSDQEEVGLKNTALTTGHAVYVDSGAKKRDRTAGPGINLDSTNSAGHETWD